MTLAVNVIAKVSLQFLFEGEFDVKKLQIVVALVIGVLSGAANALPIFVGSWAVDQGPSWMDLPDDYTGQEAAALLFGGSPGNYVISTVDDNPLHIDYLSWVSTWGAPGFSKSDHNYKIDTDGKYQLDGNTSAYVSNAGFFGDVVSLDGIVGDVVQRGPVNFAFRVPEPASSALMLAGCAVYRLRSRRRACA